MKKRIPILFFLIVLFSSLISAQEGSFLPRRAITVLIDNNYPPYVFRDQYGELQGIIPDQWKLWSRETGVPVKLRAEPWALAMDLMLKGDGDVLDTVFKTPEREKIYDFSPPYATIDVPVYVSSSISGISSIASLEGFLVAAKEGDASISQLTQNGISNIKLYPGYREIVEDAVAGNIHVFCVDKPAALYYIYKLGAQDRFKEAFILNSGQFHRAVREGDKDTLALLASGFDSISKAEYQDIERKWIGQRISGPRSVGLFLTWAGIALLAILFLTALSLYLRHLIKNRTLELGRAVQRLKDSEATAKALLNANPDSLFILDEEGLIHDYKDSPTVHLQGKVGDFLGRNVKECFPMAAATRHISAASAVLAGESQQIIEYQLEIGGAIHTFESRVLPLSQRKVLAIVRDITERKEIEEERIRSNKLESIGIFAGGIAHDFNNILTSIIGNISLVKMNPDLRPEFQAYLANAETAVDRASALTSQLLAFAKGGSPVRSGVALSPIVKETAALALAGSSCALKLEAEDEPLIALADKGQFAQALNNIVLNASQAMSEGGTVGIKLSKVKIRSGNHLSLYPGDYVSVAVTDAGMGIAPENLKRIYDPYFSTKPGAAGLGLSISHSILKHHGGGIELRSQLGRGSTFTLYVPAAAKLSEGPATSQKSLGTSVGKNLRALIMDDEASIRQFLSELLKMMQIEHDSAPEGEKALALFDAAYKAGKPYDIVFADLTVPGGMGGKEMMRIMRKRGQSFKSVVVSGYSNDPIMSSYQIHGFDACLMKPFKIKDFQKVVDELCGGP